MKRFPFCLALLLTFLLGTHKGFIALWREDNLSPEAVFPCRIESLPPADQQALKKGIRIETEQELHRLLEDYLS